MAWWLVDACAVCVCVLYCVCERSRLYLLKLRENKRTSSSNWSRQKMNVEWMRLRSAIICEKALQWIGTMANGRCVCHMIFGCSKSTLDTQSLQFELQFCGMDIRSIIYRTQWKMKCIFIARFERIETWLGFCMRHAAYQAHCWTLHKSYYQQMNGASKSNQFSYIYIYAE